LSVTGRAAFAAALFVGLVFIALNPPLQVPDEAEHFERAYAISQGVLWRDEQAGGTTVDKDIAALSRGPFLGLTVDRARRATWAEIAQALRAPQDRERVHVDMYPYASPVPYLPAAVAIAVTRACGASAALSLYAARLVHLLLYLGLCFAAARLMPYARSLLVLVMLAPAPLYLAGGMMPDAVLCSSVFFFSACALAERGTVTPALAALAFALTKPPYFLLTLLARRRVAWLVLLPCAAAIAFNLLVLASVSTSVAAVRPGLDISLGRQLGFMLTHPFSAAWTLLLSFRPVWLHHAIGAFGWMDSAIPPLLSVSFAGACVGAGVLGESAAPPRRTVIAAAVLLAAVSVAISALLYLSYTAVGAPRVEGLQGRYFVPLAPLVCVLLAAVPARRRASVERFVLPVLSVMWLAAVATLYGRYFA
jgi:uncharacterized membrane protein